MRALLLLLSLSVATCWAQCSPCQSNVNLGQGDACQNCLSAGQCANGGTCTNTQIGNLNSGGFCVYDCICAAGWSDPPTTAYWQPFVPASNSWHNPPLPAMCSERNCMALDQCGLDNSFGTCNPPTYNWDGSAVIVHHTCTCKPGRGGLQQEWVADWGRPLDERRTPEMRPMCDQGCPAGSTGTWPNCNNCQSANQCNGHGTCSTPTAVPGQPGKFNYNCACKQNWENAPGVGQWMALSIGQSHTQPPMCTVSECSKVCRPGFGVCTPLCNKQCIATAFRPFPDAAICTYAGAGLSVDPRCPSCGNLGFGCISLNADGFNVPSDPQVCWCSVCAGVIDDCSVIDGGDGISNCVPVNFNVMKEESGMTRSCRPGWDPRSSSGVPACTLPICTQVLDRALWPSPTPVPVNTAAPQLSCNGMGTCIGPNQCSCNQTNVVSSSMCVASSCKLGWTDKSAEQGSFKCGQPTCGSVEFSENYGCGSPAIPVGGFTGTCRGTDGDTADDHSCACVNDHWDPVPDASSFGCSRCTSSWTKDAIFHNCTVPLCSPPCTRHGTCLSTTPPMCQCQTGFTGPSCEVAVCNPPCVNGGECTAPNVCTCPNSNYNKNPLTGGAVDCSVCSPTWT